MQPRKYQHDAINAISKVKRGVAVLPAGSGKCFGRGTQVMLYSGKTKKVEDLKVGDFLMGDDSQPRKIECVCSGVDQLYEILPVKGDSFICNESHILSCTISGIKQRDCIKINGVKYREKDNVDISLEDYLKLKESYQFRLKLYRVSVDFTSQDKLEIKPYLLGCWLGDGDQRHAVIHKPKIKELINEECEKSGYKTRTVIPDGRCELVRITDGFFAALKSLNLLSNKHVPHHYLTSSKENRLQLLAGLLDTDGHNIRGGYDFISKDECITDAVCFLARSLGLAAYKKECQKGYRKENGEKFTGTYYRAYISGNCEIIPCKLKKSTERNQIKRVSVTGFKVKKLGIDEYFGFTLSGNNRRFLLHDFTVAHNTLIAAWATMKACNARPRERKPIVYAIAPTIEIVQQIEEAFRLTGADQVCQFEAFCYAANKSVADADLLILDEAHRVPSEQGRAWVRQAENAAKWAFTATPDRQDGQDICEVIGGSIVYRLDRQELVESGKLAPCKVKWIRYVSDPQLQVAISLEAEKKIKSFWTEEVQQKVLFGIVKKHGIELNEGRNEAIVNQAEKYAKNSTIILVGSIEHGRVLSARIGGSEMVYSGMGKKLRASKLDRFKRGELRTIIASTVLKEGADFPIADVLILVKGGRAAGELEQISGRVLRPYEGKQYGIVIDFFDECHGMLAAHSWKRFSVYKKLNYEQER